MIHLIVLTMLCVIPNLVYAASQNFTTVNPMTGEVSIGTVQTAPGGSQTYNWVGPKGDVTTGFVSPPIGGTSNYSTYNNQSGQVGVGSIQTTPSNNAPIFMPTPPPVTTFPGGNRSGR